MTSPHHSQPDCAELARKAALFREGTKRIYDGQGDRADMWFFELWHFLGDVVAALSLPVIPPAPSGEAVSIQREWLEHVISCLQGDLPSGRIGDAVFLLRDQLQDILDRAALSPAPSAGRTDARCDAVTSEADLSFVFNELDDLEVGVDDKVRWVDVANAQTLMKLELKQALRSFEAGIRAALVVPTVPQTSWQPIDSAPKDGTPVIIGSSAGVGEAWCSASDLRWRWMDGDKVIMKPSHWMPLPEPPALSPTAPKQNGGEG